MTRQEQNQIFIDKITEQLADIDNLQATIGRSFASWFNKIVQAGFQQIAATAQQAQGSGQPQGQPAAAS